MKKVGKIAAKIGTRIISALSALLAVILIAYSGYAVYDSLFTQQAAFSSWDLSKYRPVFKDGELTFEELLEINPDTVGWIIIDGTHIDYPVVQGKDDLEYANKDVFGKSSLTGSIYLTAINTRDFTNSFNLIYGHHMANGAMFGDIDKYSDYDYFYNHQEGILITTIGVYDLHVFARIGADAYDSRIYSAGDRKSSDFPDFLEYVQSLAIQWEPTTDIYDITEHIQTYLSAREANIAENGEFRWEKMPRDAIENGMQLLALSTCADAVTNGRQVLFATMKLRTEPLPDEVLRNDDTVNDTVFGVLGHGQRTYWSLVDLMCVVMTFIVLVPLAAAKAKYSRFKAIRTVSIIDDGVYDYEKIRLKGLIGFILELGLFISAVVLFAATESFHNRMTVVDSMSPVFVAIFAAAMAVDLLLFRFKDTGKGD